MSMPQRVAQYTVDEYLRIDRESQNRHEFYRGEIFAMTGGTPRHSRIKINLAAVLHTRLRGRPCQPFDSDLRIKCPTGLYTYPDFSVVCSELEFDDPQNDTVVNPTLLIEVLSKSTEGYDRGEKFNNYRTISALREYVLVSQKDAMVQTFLRNADESWTMNAVSRLDQSIALKSIGIELPLADIYEDINFPSEATDRPAGD